MAGRSWLGLRSPAMASRWPHPLGAAVRSGEVWRAALAQALSGELDAVGIVDEAVEDRVGVSRIPKHRRLPSLLMGWCLMSQ